MTSRNVAADTRKIPKTGLDYFPTPPGATRMFLSAFKAKMNWPFLCANVIEPAAGGGHMSEVLKEYFGQVHSYDIKDYGYPLDGVMDFTSPMARQSLKKVVRQNTWLITNPPFNRAAEFITGALDLGVPHIAILARLQLLEGAGRYDSVFKDRPPEAIYIHTRRVPFAPAELADKSMGKMAFAWYVWTDRSCFQQLNWLPDRMEDWNVPKNKFSESEKICSIRDKNSV